MSTDVPAFPLCAPAARPLRRRGTAAFTLAEVLAALLFMAILIPVTMHGVSVASRAGILGQRKAVAMRLAERLLDEAIITGTAANGASNGTIVDGDTTYPWTMTSAQWPEDALTQLTVQVSFDVQGNTFDVSAATIFDPLANSTTTTTTTGTAAQ
ncbi:MAG TPA: type II secretion system protein [Opitutaceae bacterium]|nr:type II secretion system protein [Opitutaceae bacterium]